MLKTRTPFKRGGPLKRSRLRRVGCRQAAANREYLQAAKAFLAAHPLDQHCLAQLGFDEEEVLRAYFSDGAERCGGWFRWRGQHIAPSDRVHHRLGRIGPRLLDQRWWLAVSRHSHEMIHFNLAQARLDGFSIPVQADADGKWGSGNQALTTPELLRSKVRP